VVVVVAVLHTNLTRSLEPADLVVAAMAQPVLAQQLQALLEQVEVVEVLTDMIQAAAFTLLELWVRADRADRELLF
jgi:hypothetical protein